MSTLDLDNLLMEIPSNPPCGEDLAYDPAFLALENTIKGTPEVQYGNTVTQKAQEPNWRHVQKIAIELCQRSHDLRLAISIIQAMLHTSGWPGFRDGLKLVAGLIDRYWENLHPLLDADDHNDPTERINVLESLCDWNTTIGPLMRLPICTSARVGSITLRDVHITSGKLKASDEQTETLTMEAIEAAFKDSDKSDVVELQEVIDESIEAVNHIVTSLSVSLDNSRDSGRWSSNQIAFKPLSDLLRELHHFLAQQIEIHPGVEAVNPSPGQQDTIVDVTDEKQPQIINSTNTDNTMQSIQTRKDVVRSLDQICAYYETNEPASPVPLLLRRAIGLVDKDFFEIVKDLAPDSIKQIQLIGGIAEDSS